MTGTRGHLQGRAGVQSAGVAECAQDADLDGRAPGNHVHGPVVPRGAARRGRCWRLRARSRRDDRHVVAVHVTDDAASAQRLALEWEEWAPGVELLIVTNVPYHMASKAGT